MISYIVVIERTAERLSLRNLLFIELTSRGLASRKRELGAAACRIFQSAIMVVLDSIRSYHEVATKERSPRWLRRSPLPAVGEFVAPRHP